MVAQSYRLVVRHNRYWRGNVHSWSTVWPLVAASSTALDTGLLDAVAARDSAICWFGPDGDQGCVWQADLYSVDLGGVPLLTKSYGNRLAPTSGTLASGAGWGGGEGRDMEPVAEVALLCEWPAGFSKSGKPVTFRKFFHAVPKSDSVGGAADVVSGQQADIKSELEGIGVDIAPYGLQVGSERRLAGVPEVNGWYANHQMPRGRRLKKITTTVFKPGSYVVVSPPSD